MLLLLLLELCFASSCCPLRNYYYYYCSPASGTVLLLPLLLLLLLGGEESSLSLSLSLSLPFFCCMLSLRRCRRRRRRRRLHCFLLCCCTPTERGDKGIEMTYNILQRRRELQHPFCRQTSNFIISTEEIPRRQTSHSLSSAVMSEYNINMLSRPGTNRIGKAKLFRTTRHQISINCNFKYDQ